MVVHNIMSQIVNISLGVSDPNPGNYTVSVKDCDVTTYTDVASSLTYSDFPFQFDVESFITGTCFEYQVIDMDSGAICYASANIPTSPTPTPTITPTPTPTPLLFLIVFQVQQMVTMNLWIVVESHKEVQV